MVRRIHRLGSSEKDERVYKNAHPKRALYKNRLIFLLLRILMPLKLELLTSFITYLILIKSIWFVVILSKHIAIWLRLKKSNFSKRRPSRKSQQRISCYILFSDEVMLWEKHFWVGCLYFLHYAFLTAQYVSQLKHYDIYWNNLVLSSNRTFFID